MNRNALAATAAVVLLLLAGCTSTTTTETITVTPGASGTYSDGDSTVVVEPLTTESSEAPAAPVEVSAAPKQSQGVSDVLVAIQLTVSDYGAQATADQIKTATDYTCDQIAGGADPSSIVALTGDIPPRANEALVQLAADSYCPIR